AALLASTVAEHGSLWTSKPGGWLYRNGSGSMTGATFVKLSEGLTDGAARILVHGKGVKLPIPNLSSLTGTVTVQLHRSGGAPCFSATYSPPFLKNDGVTFKDRAD